jgi:hypothetical protein
MEELSISQENEIRSILLWGEYVMNSPMIAIPMGGADVVLGIQWLQSLGTMAFNFQELFMKFSLEGKEIELRGITGKPGKVISSNDMTKLLKKGHQGIIAQLCSLDVQRNDGNTTCIEEMVSLPNR